MSASADKRPYPQCQDYTRNGGRCARTARFRVWQTVFPDRFTREEDARSVMLVCGVHVNSRVITDGYQFADGVDSGSSQADEASS